MTMQEKEVAIIGKSYRLPTEVDNDKDLWNALISEKDLITEVDNEIFDKKIFYHENKNRPGKSYTFSAGVLSNALSFDASFFNISAKEAAQMDPQQRILMELTWNAIEDAGYDPEDLKGKNCGVYLGIYDMDFSFNGSDDMSALEPYSPMGAAMSIAANRISYFFDFHGPSMAIDTACSSAIVALHQACSAIKNGEIEMAVVGGINLFQHPQPFIGLSKAGMLSPEGRCKSFSDSNNGYVRSEGAVVMVIKSLEQSQADGDMIKSVIMNTAVNSDGKTNGLPLPSSQAQCELMEKAYSQIGLDLNNISYLEAHGTGTKVGDPVEASSISKAIARHRSKKLPIGSIKSNLGHLEPISGLAGILKSMLCIEHKCIPPTIHCKTLNPEIDFDEKNIHVVNTPLDLTSEENIVIGVNSFGFGGTNAHAIIKGYAKEENNSPEFCCDNKIPFLLSANSEYSLLQLAKRYIEHIKHGNDDYYDLCYNSVYNRAHHQHFAVFYQNNRDGLLASLERYIDDAQSINPDYGACYHGVLSNNSEEKVCLVFSGNGSQWPGMCRDLIGGSSEISSYLKEADAIFEELSGCSIIDKIMNSDDDQLYSDTEIAQPALLIMQIAQVRYLKAKGLKYHTVTGHSVGEIAAAWACGALSQKDAITLAYYKSKVQSATRFTGRMAVVGVNEEKTRQIIQQLGVQDTVEVAGINSPKLITISGKAGSLEKIEAYCNDEETFFQVLPIDYPFHSKYMKDIETEFRSQLKDRITPRENSNAVFVSTVYGEKLGGTELTVDYWWNNIIKPVQFQAGVDVILNDNCLNFIEIGPHAILLRSVCQCAEEQHKNINAIPISKKFNNEIYELNNGLFNAWYKCKSWDESSWFPRKAPKINLPLYPWDRKKYRAKNTFEGTGPSNIKMEHPLLGWRVVKTENVWVNHIDATNCNELKDHVIGNALLFPAAAFIEMATAANQLINNNNRIGYIDNMQLISPLVLEEDISLQLQFAVDDNGYFVIKSRTRLSEADWIVHASGRLVKDSYFSTLDDSSLRKVTKDEDHHTFSSEEHYQIAASLGLNYGDAFQTVDSITFYKNLCKVDLTETASNDAYMFGATILDGGIHSLISLNYVRQHFGGDGSTAYLPAGFDSINFLNSKQKIEYAKISLLTATKSSVKADIVFYDSDNCPVIILNGARFNSANLIARTRIPSMHEYKSRLLYSYNDKDKQAFKEKLKTFATQLKHCSDEKNEEINSILEQLLVSYTVEACKRIFGDNIETGEYDKSQYGRLFWALSILEEDEYIIRKGENSYSWNSENEIIPAEDIFVALKDEYPDNLPTALYFARMGGVLDKILLGQLSEDNFISEKSGLYEEVISDSYLLRPSLMGFDAFADELVKSLKHHEKLNILEIGNGQYSSLLSGLAEKFDKNLDYSLITFDKSFAANNIKNRFNISVTVLKPSDLISKQEINRKFDLIICSDLLVYENMTENISCITTLLEAGGIVMINESVPSYLQFFFNGIKPYSYQHFFNTSGIDNILGTDKWDDIFCSTGLTHLNTAYDFKDVSGGRFTSVFCGNQQEEVDKEQESTEKKSLVLICSSQDKEIAKLQKIFDLHSLEIQKVEYDIEPENFNIGSDVLVVAPEYLDNEDLSLDKYLLAFFKELGKRNIDEKICITLLTKGGVLGNDEVDLIKYHNPKHAALWGFMRVASNEFSQQASIQMLDIQTDRINDELINLIFMNSASELVMTSNAVYSSCVFPVGEFRQKNEKNTDGKSIRLMLDSKGSFNNLHWREVPKKQQLNDHEISFKPLRVGLNFRDVMYSLGMIPEEVVENSIVGSGLGLDFSGIVEKVGSKVSRVKPGDKIMGGAPNSFGTYNVIDESTVFKLPESWSMEEGATFFTVFLTAYCSLVNLARLEKGEKILIHGAAGGVGVAAIQIVNYIGAEVYATAGSDEKRDFLKLNGVKHIYNSRDLGFVEAVKKDTDGEGVDVILNCLANEAIDANFKILKPFGRFVEMGKRDIYENYRIGLKPFRNNLSYHCINIEQLMLWRENLTAQMFTEMEKLFISGDLKPLPYKLFPAHRIKEAYKYLQSSKHIGKIVVDMADKELYREVEHVPEVNLNGTYLITGGTSGLGLDIARWLTGKGVEKLILVSRRGAIDESELNYFSEKGIDVMVRSADVNCKDHLEAIFTEIKHSGIALKGIIHAAAVYSDALINQLNPEDYSKVVLTKTRGAAYLDELSRGLDLDHFVLISSVTALFGNIGQVNYVAANSYLESLISKRRNNGLKGNYIAFGGITDTGLLTRNKKLKKILSSQMGNGLITVEQALLALEKLMSQDEIAGFAVMDISVQEMEKQMTLFTTSRFDILRHSEKSLHISENSDYKEYIKNLEPEDARNELIQLVKEEISYVMEIPLDRINQKTSVKDLGFDSLMGIDLAVSIEKRIGISVPSLSLQREPNAENIAEIILPRLVGETTEDEDFEGVLYEKHGEDAS